MSKKVKIDVVNPANGEGNDLMNCYFEEYNGSLNFYSSTNVLLYSGVQINVAFNATVDGVEFTITLSAYVAEESGSGTWVPTDAPARVQPGLGSDPTGGSFQAEAGGAGEEETASSATA